MTLAAEAAALLIVGGSLPLIGVGIGWAMRSALADRRELEARSALPAAAFVVLGQAERGRLEPRRLELPRSSADTPRVIPGELA